MKGLNSRYKLGSGLAPLKGKKFLYNANGESNYSIHSEASALCVNNGSYTDYIQIGPSINVCSSMRKHHKIGFGIVDSEGRLISAQYLWGNESVLAKMNCANVSEKHKALVSLLSGRDAVKGGKILEIVSLSDMITLRDPKTGVNAGCVGLVVVSFNAKPNSDKIGDSVPTVGAVVS